ncbi:DASH family cryptochrome [Flavobacterium sp.]
MNNLVWFRNDLRVADNATLAKACKSSGNTIAIYCFDPRHYEITKYGFKKTDKYRTKFLIESVTELKSNLAKKNISLFIYFDQPENIIPKFITQYDVSTIYLQKEWTDEEVNVTQNIKSKIQNLKVRFVEIFDQFLFHPADIPYLDYSKIPSVFTEFRKKIEKESSVRAIITIGSKQKDNYFDNSTQIPTLKDIGFEEFDVHTNSSFPFFGGENEALRRIDDYFFTTKNISQYKKTRNGLIGKNYSSKLSGWLANGSVSARTIYWNVKEYEKTNGATEDTYWLIFELLWRDYFKYISLKHGAKLFQLKGIVNANYEWKFNQKLFFQWISGRTKEPFINANMIELSKTGFMSNRGRQNAASFWAKELEQDWRIAAAYFESLLIDYDVHSNYGNWIYNAGVGNDPRNRIFNIQRQAEMYDANGDFRELWNER